MPPGDNHDRLDRLVTEDLPSALRFALRLTGCPEAAEEVVQEALYRAARGADSFAGRAQFRTWFYRIVISAFRDHRTAAARRDGAGELPGELADPRGADPAAAALADELRDVIARRVSALPVRQREVLVLIAYEQMRPCDVAEVLAISVSNVHATLHYARQRLREELAPYLAEK